MALRIYFVCTQLLLLSHIVHSFIILTANVEDVKKIARKFLSDSLAEKVAEFVAKASAQMFADKSEDNSDNEFKHENLLRQRKEITTRTAYDLKDRTTKYKEIVRDNGRVSTEPNNKVINSKVDKENNKPSMLEKIIKSISYAGQAIDWNKDMNEIAYDKSHSKESQEKLPDYEPPNIYNEQPKIKYEQSKIDFERPKLEYEQPKQDSDRLRQKEQTEVAYEPPNDYDQSKSDYQKPKTAYYHKPRKVYVKPKLAYEKPIEYVRPKPQSEWETLENQPKPESEQQNLNSEPKSIEKPKIKRKPKRLIRHHKQINLLKLRNPQADIQNAPKPTFRPTIHSTVLYNNALRLGAVKRPLERGHRLTALDPKESATNNQTDTLKESKPNQNTPSLQGFNIPVAPTTEKERKEFDQYDNPSYPKAEFIATSGPVALPKVAMMKPWWEKELLETR